MQPVAPRRLLATPRAADGAGRAATSRSSPHTDGPLDADDARGRRRARHRPPVRPEVGGAPSTAARRCSRDAELDAIERLRPRRRRADRPRRDRAGQVRQQPERPPRPLRHRDRERHRPGLRAPPQTPRRGSLADARRTAALDRAAPTSLARVDEACFYRAGTLAARTTAAASSPAPTPTAVAARARRSPPSPSTAPAASSSSPTPTSSATTASTSSTTSALWLNLVYWAAAARLRRRRRAVADSAAAADPALGRAASDAVEELRLTQEPDGSVDPPSTTPARLRRAGRRRSPTAVAGLRPHFPHQADYIDALCGRPRAPGPTAASRKPDFDRSHRGLPPRARPPRRHRAPRRLPDVQAERARRDTCFEALIVRVPWPEWSPSSSARATTTRSSSRSTLVDYTDGLRLRVRRPLPGDLLDRRAPAEPTSAAIFCDREAERFRRVCGARRRDPAASTCRRTRPPARPRPSSPSDAYIALGPDPRPHPHARRPAVRPVHDPPAQPVLDVLAGGAALRPDRVRRGRASSRREGFAFARHVQYAILFDRLFRFPITGSRVRNYDGLGGQLLFAFLHQRGLPALDRQPADDRLGAASPTASARLRERVQELYHSGIDRSKLGQWIAAHDLVADLRAAGRELGLGERAAATCPRSRSRSSSSTWSATTSSRSASSTSSSSRSSSRRWPGLTTRSEPERSAVGFASWVRVRSLTIALAGGPGGDACARVDRLRPRPGPLAPHRRQLDPERLLAGARLRPVGQSAVLHRPLPGPVADARRSSSRPSASRRRSRPRSRRALATTTSAIPPGSTANAAASLLPMECYKPDARPLQHLRQGRLRHRRPHRRSASATTSSSTRSSSPRRCGPRHRRTAS